MHLSSLIDMIESGFNNRVVVSGVSRPLSGGELASLARSAGAHVRDRGNAVVYVGENSPLLPVALLGAAHAAVPFVPLNYRLDDERLANLIERHDAAVVLTDQTCAERLRQSCTPHVLDRWVESLPECSTDSAADDDNDVAVVLYTSGTTSEPKSALLRHRHLMAYLISTVQFGSASEDEAALVSVPPYHIAGVANMLSNLFAGRRIVYMASFDASVWLWAARQQRITHAMLVPTMIARILEVLDQGGADVPCLRSVSYGGAPMPERIVRQALEAFPGVGFVNAYGLTETASTIAVLGPDDHRAALDEHDEAAARRLRSAGRPLPGVGIEIRDEDGQPLGPYGVGTVFVRGEQVAGEYATGSVLDVDGWFCTNDLGSLDEDGYLYIRGRGDDTIIRGGENIAPSEIEDVLLEHPAVREACVVGVPDDEWGQRIAAAIVLDPEIVVSTEELRVLVRARLRGSKTPDQFVFRSALPHTDTGKLLRRVIADELARSV